MKPSRLSTLFSSRLCKPLVLTVLLSTVSSSWAETTPIDLKTLIPDAPQIEASAYILMDYHSGQVLTESNADVRRNPASLTKMMTSYVIGQAIKAGKINVNDMVVVSANARSTNPVFKGSSLMFIEQGAKINVSDLNRGIIIQSGNDACVAMAEHVAGSQEGFISLMNTYINNLGLKNTRFATVHGLDADQQYSTARDMALIGQALIRDVPDEYAIYKEKEFTFSGIRQENRNRLLWDKTLSADGIKTGHTDGAGYNLVSSATEGPMRLVAVVMGSASEASRVAQSKQLLTWGFRTFETVSPLQAGKEFASEQIWFGTTDRVQLGVDSDVYLTIPRGRLADVKASYVLNTTELRAPVQKGQAIGTIDFQLDGKTVLQRPLVAMNQVEEGGFFSRLLDHIKLLFKSWFG